MRAVDTWRPAPRGRSGRGAGRERRDGLVAASALRPRPRGPLGARSRRRRPLGLPAARHRGLRARRRSRRSWEPRSARRTSSASSPPCDRASRSSPAPGRAGLSSSSASRSGSRRRERSAAATSSASSTRPQDRAFTLVDPAPRLDPAGSAPRAARGSVPRPRPGGRRGRTPGPAAPVSEEMEELWREHLAHGPSRERARTLLRRIHALEEAGDRRRRRGARRADAEARPARPWSRSGETAFLAARACLALSASHSSMRSAGSSGWRPVCSRSRSMR